MTAAITHLSRFFARKRRQETEIYMTKDSDYTRSAAKSMRWNHEFAFVLISSFFIHYPAMNIPQERLGASNKTFRARRIVEDSTLVRRDGATQPWRFC